MAISEGGITYGAAKAILSKVAENGICPDDARVRVRVDEATKLALDNLIPVGGCATVDVTAVGTTLLLPKELENAIEVEILEGGKFRNQTDVKQGFYDIVNPATYVDATFAHDNPLVDLGLVPDDDDPTILRRKYDYPGLKGNAVVRVTGARRFLPITDDNSYLIVQNLLALKFLMQAVDRFESNDLTNGDAFLQKGLGLLEAEVKKHLLDPRNTMKRKANYEADLRNFCEGSMGYTRARMAFELPGSLGQGKSELTRLLEQSEMRLMDKMDAVGTLESFDVDVFDGVLLFPARVKAVLAAAKCGEPLDIRSIFFQYLKNGPGMDCSGCANILFDEGEIYFKNTGQRRRRYRLNSTGHAYRSATSPVSVTVADEYDIGDYARFVGIPGGVAFETRADLNSPWVRQWTNPD